ncbi:hypothetical protein K435DRAFT_803833 [Dendrothele bispora CBS 962.96]|uniref:Uncharacterized protein n=1 Tax=Dendrothele bispora (strain CBS 962.96) TaxID=1314807 RepID=A0A4S8LG39_DENBC|nr:hypothetical protein K435DRAFT_803833 [Dendrothele bispora CBS 962.96]
MSGNPLYARNMLNPLNMFRVASKIYRMSDLDNTGPVELSRLRSLIEVEKKIRPLAVLGYTPRKRHPRVNKHQCCQSTWRKPFWNVEACASLPGKVLLMDSMNGAKRHWVGN